MDGDGKTKPAGKATFTDIGPGIPCVVAAVHTAVILLKEQVRLGRVGVDFMNALPELRELVGHEVGAHVFIARLPG
jgi:hypothetical protein